MTVRALIVCGIALTMLAGCGKSKEAYEKNFKEAFLKSFIKSCTESATKGGLKEAEANTKCSCVGTYLVGKYTSTELTKLTATDSPESKKIFDEAISSCK